jgi:hypothetical protein
MKASASVQSFSVPKLGDDGQKAYQVLLIAEQFEGEVIGYAAEPSKIVEAYRVLLKEAYADAAFKSLLEKATPAGQLYALCGVYYTDHAFFLSVVEKHVERSDRVHTQFGCIGGSMLASELVKAKAPNAVRLSSPKQSITEWGNNNPELSRKGYRLDIFGGGYPSMFSRQYNSN